MSCRKTQLGRRGILALLKNILTCHLFSETSKGVD